MPSLGEVLGRVVAVPGVQTCVLVGREGLLIANAGRGNARLFEALGALGASALGTAEALGQEVAQGTVISTLLEYERALVSVDPLGEYAAVVTLAENAASLGRVRQTVRGSSGELLRLLEMQ